MKRGPSMEELCTSAKRARGFDEQPAQNPFDELPDDLIINILGRVSASAKSTSELIGLRSTCKRFGALVMDKMVLIKASDPSVWITPHYWCESAHKFLTCCAKAGNIEACYFLGMIEFYCFDRYAVGAKLIGRAAKACHIEALYSLAVIQFNGSGSFTGDPQCQQDPINAVKFCIQSSSKRHADSLREVAYCVKKGIGLNTCPNYASLFIKEADWIECHGKEVHPANLFLTEWWSLMAAEEEEEEGLKNGHEGLEEEEEEEERLELCGSEICGRKETICHEFMRMRCRECNQKFYCSSACLENDWEMEHSWTCNGHNLNDD